MYSQGGACIQTLQPPVIMAGFRAPSKQADGVEIFFSCRRSQGRPVCRTGGEIEWRGLKANEGA